MVQVEHEVWDKMAELKKSFPPGIDYIKIYDPTTFVSQSIDEVIETIFIAIAPGGRRRLPVPAKLAGDDHSGGRHPGLARRHLLRSSPSSASRSTTCRCSAWCWRWASWSTTPSWWSRMSSATWRRACRPREAAHQTMTEVSTALIAIALTLCAVFVPSAFISGISGLFFKQFATTIAASTMISVLRLADS